MLPAAVFIAVSAALAPQATTSEPPPPDRPITRIVQNLGHDLKDLATVETLVILTAGGVAARIVSNSDGRADRWTVSHPASSWTAIGRVGADGWTMHGLGLGVWGIGELTNRPLVAHVGSDLFRAQVLNGVVSRTMKIAIDRERPVGGGHAFPSGHTSASFAAASVLHQHFGWKVGGPAYAAAAFVGLTRIRDRAHWVSDAVFGAALGLTTGRAVSRGHQSQTWSVMPVAVPGGAGMVFTRR